MKLIEMIINNLSADAYQTAKQNGFHEGETDVPRSLALIHSEVSEALEEDRKGNKEKLLEELADICIRVFDLSWELELNLGKAIVDKMDKNKGREYKHGKLY